MNKTQYHLQGNPVVQPQVPVVGNLIYDDLGQLVLARLNEAFRGVRGIEDTTKYNQNQPIMFSNIPRALYIAHLLRTDQEILAMTKGTLKVLNDEEVIEYWQAIPDRSSTYADTDGISLFPKEGHNEELRQKTLKLLGKKPSQVKIPLIVSGLKPVKDTSTQDGFTFEGTDFLKAREAPYLRKDCRVIYDPAIQDLREAKEGEKGVYVWTPSDQSGLRRLCRGRFENLDAWDEVLLCSDEAGRVQLLQRPQGAEK